MGYNLILHNIGFISDGVIALIFAAVVYAKNPRATPNVTFALAFISIAIFSISHVIGVNISDPIISRDVLMWNISVIYISCFLAHCSFAIVGATKKQKWFLIIMYITAVVLTAIFMLNPDTYLLPSRPKLYFPNYYVAGSLQTLMRIIFSAIVPTYFLGYLFYTYRHADQILRNRLKYFFLALLLGFGIGSMAIFLVYDIPVDPAISSPYIIILAWPMAYAILKYSLMDIRVLTKRALLFASIIACASFGIFVVGFANSIFIARYPDFPQWIVPLIAGCAATVLGYLVWRKVRESDLLKYEFVTIVTHKLRTPLTSIKWSAEEMTPLVSAEAKKNLEHIKEGTERLVELTNILADVSTEDQEKYIYHNEKIDMVSLCKQIMKEYMHTADDRKITLASGQFSDHAYVFGDAERLRIVLQTILDNALTYTPRGGTVTLSAKTSSRDVIVSAADTGIGMNKDESHLIFSRLYRTDSARKADTEGLGLGLFMAGRIVERHGGHIKVSSPGTNQGSTFTITLPLYRGNK